MKFKYKNITTDAGYKSEENYLFLESNGQLSYIKPANYEISKTRKYKNDEWRNGLQMEEYLHKTLIDAAAPNMTFEELYYYMNDLIVKNKNDRMYTEMGNRKKLSDVAMFTFEPHISIFDSKYGYKREDIYYFDSGKLIKL